MVFYIPTIYPYTMLTGNILVTFLSLGVLALSALSQVSLWQRKEYRWDRMASHLSGPEANLFAYPYLMAGYGLAALGWLYFVMGRQQGPELLGFLSIAAFACHHALRIRRQGLLRPDITVRAGLVLAAVTALLFAYCQLVYIPNILPMLQWATLLMFFPVLATIAVFVTAVPVAVVKKTVLEKAVALRASCPRLMVIGITGSYGKTSTKFFLLQILRSYKGVVAGTKDHRNSELAVARDMLEQVRPATDVYVAEMGAYRRGEIAALMQLTSPRIGVLTAISNQHLDLFGSAENLLQAKQEILMQLPSDGTAILNADDVNVQTAAKAWRGRRLWYSTREKADVWAEHISLEPKCTRATVHIGSSRQEVLIPVVSDGLLHSVLAAVAAAHALHMEPGAIFAVLGQLHPFPRTMEIRLGKQGITIIDDSYSASEHAVVNALDHLGRFSVGHKIVAMVPLIELHKDGRGVHERLGIALAQTQAQVFIYGKTYQAALERGFTSVPSQGTLTFIHDPTLLLASVHRALKPMSVVLLEGRLPDVLRSSLM